MRWAALIFDWSVRSRDKFTVVLTRDLVGYEIILSFRTRYWKLHKLIATVNSNCLNLPESVFHYKKLDWDRQSRGKSYSLILDTTICFFFRKNRKHGNRGNQSKKILEVGCSRNQKLQSGTGKKGVSSLLYSTIN